MVSSRSKKSAPELRVVSARSARQPAPGPWFEVNGRPLADFTVTDASGKPLRVPLPLPMPRNGARPVTNLESEVARFHEAAPAGACAASACLAAAAAFVDEIAARWPSRDRKHAEHEWCNVVVYAAALRDLVGSLRRDRWIERRFAVYVPQSARKAPTDALRDPVVNFDPFEAAGSRESVATWSGDTHVSLHHAAREVVSDILCGVLFATTRVGLLLESEPWHSAVARIGATGERRWRLLGRVWQRMLQGRALVNMHTGDRNLWRVWTGRVPPTLAPADLWPAWGSLDRLLRAELARVAILADQRAQPEKPTPTDLMLKKDAAEAADLTVEKIRGWCNRKHNRLVTWYVGGREYVSLQDVMLERDLKVRTHQRKPTEATNSGGSVANDIEPA